MLIFLWVAVLTDVHSQTNELNDVKQELYKINKRFDSAQFLAFDVEIEFKSDTILGRFEADRQKASYVLNGSNVYYSVAGMEYMQNDSFAITAYNNDQVMLVTKQAIKKNSSLFPLKEFVDSSLSHYSIYYTISIDSTGSDKVIKFKTDSINVPYQSIAIYYEPLHYTLLRVEMSFKQPFTNQENMYTVPDDSTAISSDAVVPAMVSKYINMDFKNYHFISDVEIFDYKRYIFYDRFRKAYMTTGKYLGYKLMASNLESTGTQYDDIETPAIPVEPKL